MSQETGTPPAASEAGPAPAHRGLRRLAAGLLRWLRDDLFRRTENVPVSWPKVVFALIGVAAAMAVSLSRTTGPGSLNTVWIEDAKFLLNQGLNEPFWTALTSPISTYYQEPAQ